MSFKEDLLLMLSNFSGDYPAICARIRHHSYSKFSDRESNNKTFSVIPDNTLRTTLSRLKKKGLVENYRGEWKITPAGLVHIEIIKNKVMLPKHSPKLKTEKPKNMIIIFDIHEDQKQKRAWLRIELVNLGFELLQKSVWFGPAPLPKEFINSLDELNLLPYLKFFKATEEDVV